MIIDEMLKHKEEFVPEIGFNLVGMDDFEIPGEELYMISHHRTLKGARAAAAARTEDEIVIIYDSKGNNLTLAGE